MIAGITYNFLPFMALPLYVSLEKIDRRLIEAATDLYASRTTAFRKVTLPLALPGIFAGSLLTFIPACGDFINAALLGTPRQYMIGNVIQTKYLVHPGLPDGGGAVVHPDGLHPRRDLPVRPRARRAQPDRGGDLMAVEAPPKVAEIIAGELKPSRRPPRATTRARGRSGSGAALALLYLFIPIFVIVVFSFNDPKGRFNFTWQGFTLDHWKHPFADPDLALAMKNSLVIAADLDGDRGRARHVHGARARALRVPRPRRRSTSSSSCRCRRPRS